MCSIQASIQLFDGMTPVLKKIINTMDSVISTFENMEKSSGHLFDIAKVQESRTELNKTKLEFDQIEGAVKKAKEQVEKFNQNMKLGKEFAEGLKGTWGKISKVLGAAGIAVNAKEIFSGANNYKAAGNTLQGQTGMQGGELEMAKQSMKNLYVDNMGKDMEDIAESMSTVYQITGQTGAGLEQLTRAGMLLRDTFGFDVTDSMKTAEIMEKQFGVSGAQAFDLIIQGVQAGLNKNGDLLDIINEYSGQFSKMGFSSTDMFQMLINGAQNGTLSVDKLGNAVKEFSNRAIDGSKTTLDGFNLIGLDINEMVSAFSNGGEAAKQAFQQTMEAIGKIEDPIKRNTAGVDLFGTVWDDLGAEGIMALSNMNGSIELTSDNLEALNSVKYDDAASALASLGRTVNMGLSGVVGNVVNAVTKYIGDFTTGLQGETGQIQSIFGGIGFVAGEVGRAISEAWPFIEPIIWGVVAAFAAYEGYLIITNGLELISTGIKIASTIASLAYAVATKQETGELAAAAAAQLGLNAAMLASPITWIIIGLIAFIALCYVIVAVINNVFNTSYSAIGSICGAFAVAGAFILNSFAIPLYNIFAMVGNFIGNVFSDPLAALKILFYDLALTVIGYIVKMAQAIEQVINKIPGVKVDITSGIDSFYKKLESVTQAAKDEADWIEYIKPLEYFDYGDAAKSGYEFGQGVEKKVGGAFDNIKDTFIGGNDNSSIPGTMEGIYGNTGNTAGNTAKMADAMDAMDEDLKYMRDAAEQEIINRFTLAELKVDVRNNNTLKTQTDFNDVIHKFGEITSEILSASAEGDHL